MNFKEYLTEAKSKEVVPPTMAKNSKEVQDFLGKSRMMSMIKNPFFARYNTWEHAFRYSRDKHGFITVDVFPFFGHLHRQADGKIKATVWLEFKWWSGYNVGNVNHYYRDETEEKGHLQWKHVKTWKEEPEIN